MSISFKHSGSFKNMESFFKSSQKINLTKVLTPYGKQGVQALSAATPKLSGVAAGSWDYQIIESKDFVSIFWTNNDVEGGFPVVIGLQYGYATGTGGYVQGRDFINPAIRPVFDKIADAVWNEVVNR